MSNNLDQLLTCRPATKSDLRRVIELLADDPIGKSRESLASDDFFIYERAFDAMLTQSGNELLLAEDGRGIVGVLQLTVIAGVSRLGTFRAQIEAVRVSSQHRGKGVGTWLIENACARAKTAGCRLIQLTTDKRRIEARRFYERAGFVATHEGMKRDV